MARPPAAPSPAPPSAIERNALTAALLALGLLIAALTIYRMSNNDIWIHLKTGENIVRTWQVPDKDPYSFTASDHDYVAHEWLSGVLFYLVYAAAGVNGLIFFKSAVIYATCAALWMACRFRRDDPIILFPCFTLMLFIGSARFLERPHIFSYLFAALYLMCYFGWREGGRRRAWLYAIPLLHVVWTNLHGGHYQGIFLLVMLAAAEAIMLARARWLGLARQDASAPAEVGIVCLLPVASWLMGLVNPYGYRLLTFPFELTGQEIFMRGIYEWQSALFPSYNLSSMFLYYIIWIAVLFGSFLLVRGHAELRGGLRETAWSLNLVLGALWLLFVQQLSSVYQNPAVPSILEKREWLWYGVVALFLAANLHRLEFHHAGIVALFFALSLRHNRAVTDAAVATLPTLSHNLNGIVRRLAPRGRGADTRTRAILLAALAVTMAGLAAYTFRYSYAFGFKPVNKRETGLGIASNMPTGAVDYIQRNRITGRAFPSYNAAAMLIHRMWPEVTVSMDSRNDVYGEALYREYVAALAGGPALEAYLKKWQIDFLLITYGQDRGAAFFRTLDESPDWALVYFDDRSVVYLRNIPRFQAIIQRDRFELINPAAPGSVEVRPEDAARWLAEAERAEAAAPGSWVARQYRSKSLIALNRLDEAETLLRKILQEDDRAFYAWADLGFIHLMRNQPREAAEAFNRCLELRPDYPPCRQYATRPGPR